MEEIKEIEIATLLDAREKRQELKQSLIQEGYHLISLQLNIPGLPKTNKLITTLFRQVTEEFERFFASHLPVKLWTKRIEGVDASGDYRLYLFDLNLIDSTDLKELTEQFEGEFTLGRLVDLDVFDASGHFISSGKAKKCFLCEKPANVCRQIATHPIEEVRQAMLNAMEQYMEDQKLSKLSDIVSSLVTEALLQEVSLSPKPGLVCRLSNGAHTDMDYASFVASISAISPYINKVAQYAIRFKGKDVSVALPAIRQIGLQMEMAMNKATKGVNTHKGAIFLMSICTFAIIRVVIKQGYFKANKLSSVIQQLCRGMIQRELCGAGQKQDLSHGQVCFNKYGLQGTGARGEAEQGLPSVMHHALPYLQRHADQLLSHSSDKELNDLLIPVLLKIMSVNNDTNILFRHDKLVLEQVKKKASAAIRVLNEGDEGPYKELVDWCNNNRISPGGSADLLAVTILIYNCQKVFAEEWYD